MKLNKSGLQLASFLILAVSISFLPTSSKDNKYSDTSNTVNTVTNVLLAQTYMEEQVNQLTSSESDSSNKDLSNNEQQANTNQTNTKKKRLSRKERKALNKKAKAEKNKKSAKKKRGYIKSRRKAKSTKAVTSNVSNQVESQEASSNQFAPISINGNSNSPKDTSTQQATNQDLEKKNLEKQNKELRKITKERQVNSGKTIDAMNFIQPSLSLSEEEQVQIDNALTRAEQEQLTILWRATLERNKTIRFIVEKLAPEDRNKKKNQVLSQILNTAIFLPFYALQSVTPADTSALASYVGAGLASDLINGKARKNSDRMQLSQTEMVIMFMMIDQVAERVREQYHEYKQERVDEALAVHELKEAKLEAAAALDTLSPESQFLSQIRIRQIERELRRINLRVRSNKIVLTDLAGGEAVSQVDQLIDKEIAAVIDLPELISASSR